MVPWAKVEVVTGAAASKPVERSPDVTLLVGTRRTPLVYNLNTLRGAAYFRSLLDAATGGASPLVFPIDCEESIFHHLMAVLRYGTLEALPPLTPSDRHKLLLELDFYGIPYLHSQPSSPDLPSVISQSALPDFPSDLLDPAKIVLISKLDDNSSHCRCSSHHSDDKWALNFHYRHAFCTSCGNPASSTLSPKNFAEMFLVAASYFAGEVLNPKKWFVGCDSTCALKFVPSKSCCGCSACSKQTVWAASIYHSHAFCTHCGNCAEGSSLVCILLALRYGGHYKSPKSRKGSPPEVQIPSRKAPTLLPAPTSRTPSYLSQRSA